MTNSSPPEHRPPRRQEDEAIAVIVTFLAFGAIFGWGITQGQAFNPSGLLSGFLSAPPGSSNGVSPDPSVPTITPSPTPNLGSSQQATLPGQVAPSLQPGSDQAGGVPPNQAVPDNLESPDPQATISPAPAIVPVPVPSPSQTPAPKAGAQRPSPTPTARQSPVAFSDVGKDYWAYPFIAALSAKGIIGGFPDGTFKPNQPVTRGQFAVQLQKAFTKPDQSPAKQFTDVPPDNLWAIAVDKAVKANFMNGYPDGTFRTEQQVSRVEAVAAVVRGLGLPEPPDPEAVLQSYVDRDQVPNWARAKVAAAVQAGLFSGDPDTRELSPNQPASRADITALVYQALERSVPNRDRVSNRSATNNAKL